MNKWKNCFGLFCFTFTWTRVGTVRGKGVNRSLDPVAALSLTGSVVTCKLLCFSES